MENKTKIHLSGKFAFERLYGRKNDKTLTLSVYIVFSCFYLFSKNKDPTYTKSRNTLLMIIRKKLGG